jgi:hypothetical protein
MNNLTPEDKETIKRNLYSITQKISNILTWDFLDHKDVKIFFECLQYDLKNCMEIFKEKDPAIRVKTQEKVHL